MTEHHDNSSAHQQTRAAIDAMQAYFAACSRGASRAERERLERDWLSAARRLRIGSVPQ